MSFHSYKVVFCAPIPIWDRELPILDPDFGLRMFAAKKQETVLEAQTRELNVPRYLFLQRVKCGYEMAWNHPKHEFKTEIVDWACSLRHNKKWFWRHKLVHLMHPILIFTMGQVRQRNGVKPLETRVLDVKYMVRNQTDVLEHRNGVQIPKM